MRCLGVLAACEAAVLLIDASQGIQAQTMANVYLAVENDLVIIPAINKIDMPAAEPERVASEMADTFGFSEDEMLWVSGKTGEGCGGVAGTDRGVDAAAGR